MKYKGKRKEKTKQIRDSMEMERVREIWMWEDIKYEAKAIEMVVKPFWKEFEKRISS